MKILSWAASILILGALVYFLVYGVKLGQFAEVQNGASLVCLA